MSSPVPPERLSRVQRNVARMRALGAPEEDIVAYLEEEDRQPAPASAPGPEPVAPSTPGRGRLDRTLGAIPLVGPALQAAGRIAPVGGMARSAAQGFTAGFSDELRGVGAAAIPGGQGYTEARDAEREALDAFRKEHPVLTPASELAGAAALPIGGPVRSAASLGTKIARGAATGAGLGAAYGLGTGEGDLADQLPRMGWGAVAGGAAGAALPLAGAALPGLARIFGITTAKGTDKAVDQAIASALEATGQSMDDVTARVAAAQAAGKPITFVEALGPAADEVLGQMGPLGNEMRGRVFQAAQEMAEGAAKGSPERQTVSALLRAQRKRAQPVNMGQVAGAIAAPLAGSMVGGPVGAVVGGATSLAFSPLAKRAVTAGVTRATRKENEALVSRLLQRMVAEAPDAAGTVGRGPKLVPRPVTQPFQARPPETIPTPRIPGVQEADPEVAAVAELVKSKAPSVVPTTPGARLGRGATQKRFDYWADRLAQEAPGQFSEDELLGMAKHLADPANQDENLELLLQLTLERAKRVGRR